MEQRTLMSWREGLVALLIAEEATSLDDAELRRVFEPCVSPLCLQYARELVEMGAITLAEIIGGVN